MSNRVYLVLTAIALLMGVLLAICLLFHRYHVAACLVRYVVYAVFIYCWPRIIIFVGRWRVWPSTYIVQLKAKRWFVFSFFLIIEVFFFYNLLGRLFAVLS